MNTLYYGDNLQILREHVADKSIDLIYLDPPFNSKATYNILFDEPTGEMSEAQIAAFEDTWHWGIETEQTFQEIVDIAPTRVVEFIQACRDNFIGRNDVMAYLTMMCIRLLELQRALKDTGSIYLHCDPTASHYLKVLMDAIFLKKNFRNEIIWHYRKWPTGRKQFQRNHDVILFYCKSESENRTFNELYMERAASTLKRFGTAKIISGHDAEGKRLPSQMAEEESIGVRQDDVWDIGRVPPIKQLFPTQKPHALLERIILASSNEGDIVLDPFCGCGTATVAAHELKRQWLGIDVTHLAINLIKWRLRHTFGLEAKRDYRVVGEPVDLAGAKVLAGQNRYQFQWWACSLIDARPYGDKKKGADTGIDGILFIQEKDKIQRGIVSVKSGSISPKDVRDLGHVIDREKAAIGILVTLVKPTVPMKREAASKGLYKTAYSHKTYPRLQIITIKELLDGQGPHLPPTIETFKKATRVSQNLELEIV